MKIVHLKSVFAILFVLFLYSSACEKDKEEHSETTSSTESESDKKTEMDMLTYSFEDGYDDLWRVVDSLERLGLYESALSKVELILNDARQKQNAPQVVKLIMFKMKYNSYLADDDFVLALNDLNELSKNSKFPLKQLIHSVTADSYWTYYQNNRWKFLNRSHTVNAIPDDVRTWDLKTISYHVNKHFLLSLSSPDSLQHAKISDFKEILITENNTDHLRPTLFDFLAFRAIEYFQNPESELNKPAEKFLIEGEKYFGSATEFSSVKITTPDSMSHSYYASAIFQDLTKFHLNDKKPEALIDLELKRLAFMKMKSVDEKKNHHYIAALNKLADKYESSESWSEIKFHIASYHNSLGNQYSKQNEEVRWEKKKAHSICKESIEKYPESFGAHQCRSLITQIEAKELTFNTENTYTPNTTGKMLVNYKNLDTIYFKIVKVKWDYFLKNRFYGEELISDLLKKETIENWSKTFSDPGDYQSHNTEISLKGLTNGQYVILGSPDKNFKLDTNAITYSSFWSSNLSYNYRRNEDDTYDVFVTDRESGKPVQGVNATIYIQKYNYTSREYEISKQESYLSDSKGMFTIRSKGDYRNIYIDLTKGNDRYNNSSQIYQYKPYKENKSYSTTYFFTDRSIYRPGQTIHFKGIKVRHNDDNKHNLETGKASTVTFYDVNHQKVGDLKLVTNKYGTFSGSFTAPSSITGQMYIADANGTKYFSVEEYKRPKFEVGFEPVKGSYKLGQTVKVKGFSKSFSGSNVDGASVNYRIVRSSYFPSYTWYRWGYYPHSSSVEISNGITKTDEKGEFTIQFDAKEDPGISAKYKPNYSYQIIADVTDINGETHSSQQYVYVGYNALNLNFDVPSKMERSQKNRFRINTTNLSSEKIPTKGTISIHLLKEPNQPFRSKLWNDPDIQEFTKDDYRRLFPNDEFGDENNMFKFEKVKEVFNSSFNTDIKDSIDLAGMNTWEAGRYVVTTKSIDEFGSEVEDIRYFTLLDRTSKINPTNEIWLCTNLKPYCEPGEVAEFLISSAVQDLNVVYEIEHKGVIVKRENIVLSKSQKRITIPIEEKHRGNFTVHFLAVHSGRSYHSKEMIYVPYSNKDLELKFETFRDKLKPGQNEEWKIIIKGPKGEKVAAEMLATLYDASLDEFASNSFYMGIYNSYYSTKEFYSNCFSSQYSQTYNNYWNPYHPMPYRTYDNLNYFGFSNRYYGSYYYRNNGYYELDGDIGENEKMLEQTIAVRGARSESKEANMQGEVLETATTKDEEYKPDEARNDKKNGEMGGSTGKLYPSGGEMSEVKARSNFSETAFFMPQMETNAAGEIIIKFTLPESLTKWKFLGMAHTTDLKIGYLQKELLAQKELMVVPNAPRFLREGDTIQFSSKISNLSDKDLTGQSQLMLFDATTMKPIDSLFNNFSSMREFNSPKGQSSQVSWTLKVPYGIGAVVYRIVAKSENHTDGEEMTLPILSNRMLVTESMPLPSKGIGTKNFTFEKLIQSGASNSIKHHKLTLEYTSNPAWYAIQAMPYMMEYPHECSEQIFTRFYTNSIASNIINSSPKIKAVFDSWKSSSPDAFLSNLEKNQELKSVLLEETPWVLDAKNESERKKRVALLFNMNKMDNELDQAMRKLQKMQVSNGGWPWFPGMQDNRYITQHIITGMGHLDNLGVKNVHENKQVWNMVLDGVRYLDQRIIEDYEWLKKHDPHYLTEQRISQIQVQYLYARSYFKDIPIYDKLQEAFNYYQSQANQYWKNFNLYNEGMIALEAHRYGNVELANRVMASLKERAIEHDELGMYWKDNVWGYYWYDAPIETQALLIEAFDEVTNDIKSVNELKVWLLKQKQTTDWKTTKATAEACYALLLRGTDWLVNEEPVEIKVNNVLIDPKAIGATVEAGTGYFKTSWSENEIDPNMGNVSVTRKTDGVSWGAMYWQYFEDLDKITPHETPLKLNKKLYLVENTTSGPVIKEITTKTKLKPGDKIRVRIELRSDRNMEYVHLKDMRASGLEPINVFSQYKWQDGLGYYESTRDAATNFFMDYVPKGTYVFEYDLRVSHFGSFSNGIASIQCMYAPEFTSHSEGIRLKIEEK